MRSPPMWLVLVVLVLAPPVLEATQSDRKSKESKTTVKDEKILKAIESNLLSLIGLQHPPRINRRDVTIPQAMLDLYRQQTGMDVDTTNLPLPGRLTGSANTVRSFQHKESKIDEQFKDKNRFRLAFDVATIPKSESLQASELHIRIETDAHILVHDIMKPGVRGKQSPILRVIDSRRVKRHNEAQSEQFVKLDVTPAVQRWLHDSSNNHGLLVTVHNPSMMTGNRSLEASRTHVRLKRDVTKDEWKKVQPILYTFTDDGKQKKRTDLAMRPRRATRKSKWKGVRDICRRHEMYVDFAEVGWNDWILAPKGYDGYYCAGDCPFILSDQMNTTNHAIVQTLINSAFPNYAPKACCVPTSLTSISMLYVYDEGKVMLKNYEDMSVEGCGCR